MIITLKEILDIFIMTLVVGYVFRDFFPFYPKKMRFYFACIVTAPALTLHELAHKFVAILLGLQATFHAAYFWLIIGIILKLFHSPFLFFIPGYVSFDCNPLCNQQPLQTAIIAFSGPFFNLILFAWSALMLKYYPIKKKRTRLFFLITKRINIILFCFNMLPIPPFDGYQFFAGLYHAFFIG